MTPEYYTTMLFLSAVLLSIIAGAGIVLMDDYSISINHKRKRNQWRTR